MIYIDAKNRRIELVTIEKRKMKRKRVELTEQEIKLIMILSDNEEHMVSEISKYIYGDYESRNNIRVLRHRIKEKIKTDIIYSETRGKYMLGDVGFYI